MIEGIDRLSLEGNEEPPQLVGQPETSQKIPKWLSKTLESVHPNEVEKTRTRSSYKDKIENGAVKGSYLGNDVNDSSYDYELNFFADCELTSFKEAFSHDI